MVIDSSALIAILLKEPEALAFAQAIDRAETVLLSSANYLEANIVMLSRFGDNSGARDLETLILKSHIQIESFTEEQARLARKAFEKYGKGRHPANLNYGDCFAYALAKDMDEPLLFKGDDFLKTDILPVNLDKAH